MNGGAYRAPRDGEHVAVQCWCRGRIVYIDVVEIRRGRTRTCGRPDCKPNQEA